MNTTRRLNLRRLLNPRSVALVGGRTLAPSIEMLRRAGYDGKIRVVNPSHAEIGGIACTPTIDDLPESPDAAFLNVNRHLTIEAVAALSRREAGGAVCFAAGFGEMGETGKSLQGQLVAAAGDLAIVGPNSNGLLNRLDRLALVPDPGRDLVAVVAALVDGLDLVAVAGHERAGVRTADRQRLAARARQRGTVLIALGSWPGADLELTCTRPVWEGLVGGGAGRLRARRAGVRVRGRGIAPGGRETRVLLPGPVGAPESATVDAIPVQERVAAV